MNQTQKDEKFMAIAFDTAAMTDDPKAQIDSRTAVGAVITIDDRILGKSANRLPPKLRGKYRFAGPESPERYHFLEHAERCAIYDAAIKGVHLKGATLYCTRFPCIDCARVICYFALGRIVVASGFGGEEKWIASQRAARNLLRLTGVTIRYLKSDGRQ